jgi:hypothetical protein
MHSALNYNCSGQYIINDMEGSIHGLIWGIIPVLPGRAEENQEEHQLL